MLQKARLLPRSLQQGELKPRTDNLEGQAGKAGTGTHIDDAEFALAGLVQRAAGALRAELEVI